jgi:hypothetical protein
MMATAIPVGAIRHPADARPLPVGMMATQVRRPRGNPPFGILPAVAAAIIGLATTVVGAATTIGVTVGQNVAAQRATLEGLYNTINNKKQALANAKNEDKKRRLRDEIAALQIRIDLLKAQMVEATAPTPWGLYAAGGLAVVVVVGGLGYLVLGRKSRRNPRRRRSHR